MQPKRASDTSDGYIYFYSKSKTATARHLSNFHVVPEKLVYRGVAFPSVENAFQAAKYLHSTRPELFETLAHMTPAAAKSAGGKGGMKKVGAVLDVDAWTSENVRVMRELITIRAAVDEEFRRHLGMARARGLKLLHFERPPRGGGLAFWGGSFANATHRELADFRGENMLGRIMMDCN